MQIYAHDRVEVHPQKEKEILYLVKKGEIGGSSPTLNSVI